MSNDKILKNNKFANCTRSELLSLWCGLKQVYTKGWNTTDNTDNPLNPYKDAYCEESNTGLDFVERDLLIAIAYEFCG